jgi:adenine deaminase
MEVLKAATWNGIYAIGRTDQLGSIEPGKLADFVILNANPLESIINVRQVYRVVKGGVVYDRDKLLNGLVGLVSIRLCLCCTAQPDQFRASRGCRVCQ